MCEVYFRVTNVRKCNIDYFPNPCLFHSILFRSACLCFSQYVYIKTHTGANIEMFPKKKEYIN